MLLMIHNDYLNSLLSIYIRSATYIIDNQVYELEAFTNSLIYTLGQLPKIGSHGGWTGVKIFKHQRGLPMGKTCRIMAFLPCIPGPGHTRGLLEDPIEQTLRLIGLPEERLPKMIRRRDILPVRVENRIGWKWIGVGSKAFTLMCDLGYVIREPVLEEFMDLSLSEVLVFYERLLSREWAVVEEYEVIRRIPSHLVDICCSSPD
jgi:hypothetical protein